MVARLSDLPTPWIADSLLAPKSSPEIAGPLPIRLALRGQMMLERASSLEGISIRGCGIPGIKGTALHLAKNKCRHVRDAFIRDRIFAVIGDDGSMVFRLPHDLADDLVDSGLCIRLGKNLLTWAVENEYQLELNWRILLHAYWNIVSTSPTRARRLLSEWVIQH